MIDRQTKNIEIFEDTAKYIISNKKLQDALRESVGKQKIYYEFEEVVCNTTKKYENTGVVVSKKRTLEAAKDYAKAGKRVCVMNFASATNPGGGVTRGSSAQEEALCRCSTLYPCLNRYELMQGFYGPHRSAANPLYNDDCIYTPGVVVFKSDVSFPERMNEEEWYTVDVITCAAPNLRDKPSNSMNPFAGKEKADITEEELMALLMKRIDRIFAIAKEQGAEVLILGAFGCGAFCNPPEIVAKAFCTIQKKYQGCFETIEYAVFCTDYECMNYEFFRKEFEQ